MKPEARFWATLKKKLPLPGDRLDRVENSVMSGQPDVNGCLASEDVWIELKAPTEPKRATTPLMTSNGNHPLLPSQINWFIAQRQAGGIAFVLIRTDKRLMLLRGTDHAERINVMTVEQMVEASLWWTSFPVAALEWRLLRNVIFTASRRHRLHRHATAQQLLNDMDKVERLAGDRKPGRCSGT